MRGFVRVLVLGLILILVPAMVIAGTVSGTATAGNEAPSITGASLASAALTPQVATTLNIGVSEPNTLVDVDRIEITIFHDTTAGAGTPGDFASTNFDADEKALFKWDSIGSTWSMVKDGGVSTSWAVNTGSCVTPTLTSTTGTFTLSFTPGKLAKQAAGTDVDEWNAYVKVYDGAGASDDDNSEVLNSMAAYVELSLDPSSVGFDTVPLGGTGTAIQTPVDHILTTQVLTNTTYLLSTSAGNWSGSGYTLTLDEEGSSVADGSFSLCIDDAADGSGYPSTPQWLGTSSATVTGYGSEAAPATAANTSEVSDDNNFYVGIKLGSSNIPRVSYSGNITITATNP